MADRLQQVSRFAEAIARHRGMLLPLAALGLIFVILVPLPTGFLDFMLIASFTLSALILLTVMFMRGPLEFSSFPSVLLAMTLLRLVLNTASTRLILTNADEGTAAAGKVIETFGEFVAGGSVVVGVIIFAIFWLFFNLYMKPINEALELTQPGKL